MGKANYSVYILHFDRPYWSNCQHYVGYTNNLERRLQEHRTGNGSKLIRYANSQGIGWALVAVEVFDNQQSARRKEIWIKKSGGGGKLCPVCQYPGLSFKDMSAIIQEKEHGKQ